MTGAGPDLPEDREALARSLLPRARAIARNLSRHRPWEYDEAESVAVAAIAEVLRGFDPARGVGTARQRLERHANMTIGNRVVNALRADRPKGKGRSPLLATARPVELSSLPGAERAIEADEDPVGWALDAEDGVMALSRALPPRHGELVRTRYLRADAAALPGLMRRMHLGDFRVCQLHREALDLLRARAAREGRSPP